MSPANGFRANAARIASQGPSRPAVGHMPFPGRTMAEVLQFEEWQRKGQVANVANKAAYNAAVQAREAVAIDPNCLGCIMKSVCPNHACAKWANEARRA